MKGFPSHITEGNLSQHMKQAEFHLEINGNHASGWLAWPQMQSLVARKFPQIKIGLRYGPWYESYSFNNGREFYRAVLDGFEQVACICARFIPPAPEPLEAACAVASYKMAA